VAHLSQIEAKKPKNSNVLGEKVAVLHGSFSVVFFFSVISDIYILQKIRPHCPHSKGKIRLSEKISSSNKGKNRKKAYIHYG